jgi:hypothetical protein
MTAEIKTLIAPITVKDDADKAEYFYRMKEKLRLWHNQKAKEMNLSEFRKWQNDVYKPKEKRMFAELNKVRTVAQSEDDDAPRIEKENGQAASKWDVFIDVTKV